MKWLGRVFGVAVSQSFGFRLGDVKAFQNLVGRCRVVGRGQLPPPPECFELIQPTSGEDANGRKQPNYLSWSKCACMLLIQPHIRDHRKTKVAARTAAAVFSALAR